MICHRLFIVLVLVVIVALSFVAADKWDVQLKAMREKTRAHEGMTEFALALKTRQRSQVNPELLVQGVQYNDMSRFTQKEAVEVDNNVKRNPFMYLLRRMLPADADSMRLMDKVCKHMTASDCNRYKNLNSHLRKEGNQMWSVHAANVIAGHCVRLAEKKLLSTSDQKWCAEVAKTYNAVITQSRVMNSHFGCQQAWHAMAPISIKDGVFYTFTNAQVARQIISQSREWWNVAVGEFTKHAVKSSAMELRKETQANSKVLKDTTLANGLAAHDPIRNKPQGVVHPMWNRVRQILDGKRGGDFEIGQLLHTIQDSYASAHTVRQGPMCGDVMLFQGYSMQDSALHGADDHNPNFSPIDYTTADKVGLGRRRQLWRCAETASAKMLSAWAKCKTAIRRRPAEAGGGPAESACAFPDETIEAIFKVASKYQDDVAGGTLAMYKSQAVSSDPQDEFQLEVKFRPDSKPQGCKAIGHRNQQRCVLTAVRLPFQTMSHSGIVESSSRIPSQRWGYENKPEAVCNVQI